MTPAEIMDGAADLIERTGWTQAVDARDANGGEVDIDSPRAVCFCMGAALFSASKGPLPPESCRLFEQPVHTWNDAPGRTKAEVLAALRDGAAKWRRDHP